MNLDRIVLLISWISIAVALIFFIPRNRIREAWVAFLFKQAITWPIGLWIAHKNMIKYPVRIFENSTTTSFTFEYFAYPAICALFNIHYPKSKNKLKRFIYYIAYTSGITVFELILEKNTDLIEYISWSRYWTWITIFITFYISRQYFKWFFRIKES